MSVMTWKRRLQGRYVSDQGYEIHRGPSWKRSLCWTSINHEGSSIGIHDTLRQAKERCEIHRAELVQQTKGDSQ